MTTPDVPAGEGEARKLIHEKIRSVSFASANNSGLTTREIDEEANELLAELAALSRLSSPARAETEGVANKLLD